MRDILFLVNYGITPDGHGGRAELPVEVDTWLPAVEVCLARIRGEAQSPK